MKPPRTQRVIPLGMPRRPSVRPPALRRSGGSPPTIEEFALGGIELQLAFPSAYDATTTQGLAALRAVMGEQWPEAMAAGRSTHPLPARGHTLDQLLTRGSARVMPQGPGDLDQVRNRRSALAHLQDSLPRVKLAALDERGLEALVQTYRRERADLSSAMVSSHITELRMLVGEARTEAGLRALDAPPAPPTRRQGRRAHRPIATLEQVIVVLDRAPPWLRVLVGIMLAAPLPQTHALRLTRGALDLEGGRIRVHTWRTRRAGSPEGHMIYGLPRWCVDLLLTAYRGIETWPPDRLLFPGEANPGRPRSSVAAAFRTVADRAGCPELRLQDIRRLSQAIHVRAPRAVRRATATARQDVQHSLESGEAQLLADAQEAYASDVVRGWRQLPHPPVMPRRAPPVRALRGVAPHEPERRWRGKGLGKPRVGLPGSCLPGGGPEASPASQAGFADAQPIAAYERELPQIPALLPAFDMPLGVLQAQMVERLLQQVQVADLRRVHAERQVALLLQTTLPKDEAYGLAAVVAMTAFAAGLTVESYLNQKPALREELGQRVGAYALALGEVLQESLGVAAPVTPSV